jgi:hypothetical protein
MLVFAPYKLGERLRIMPKRPRPAGDLAAPVPKLRPALVVEQRPHVFVTALGSALATSAISPASQPPLFDKRLKPASPSLQRMNGMNRLPFRVWARVLIVLPNPLTRVARLGQSAHDHPYCALV